MAVYPLLDPLWSRFPWPDRVAVETTAMGLVTRVGLVRQYFGRSMMATHCYVVGDTLVDTGFPAAREEVLELARSLGVRRAVVSHHHEDHAGNAGALAAAGLEVLAGEMTCRLLAADLPLPFYQHLVWGRARAARIDAHDGRRVRIGPYEAEVIEAPGHAVDQLAYYVAERGWLFSADVFIHERVKVFRADADFAASVRSLERLVGLDFDVLFCGHRPLAEGGRSALEKKLQWLRELEGEVRRLDAEGMAPVHIVRRLRLERSPGFRWLTFGDASAHNMVRSILRGPKPRREVAAALA